jgi:hypothetical protein
MEVRGTADADVPSPQLPPLYRRLNRLATGRVSPPVRPAGTEPADEKEEIK